MRKCVYVCGRVCVCLRAYLCGRACVYLIVCVCFRVCVFAYVFLHECVLVGGCSSVSMCS